MSEGRENEVVQAFVRMSNELVEDYDVVELLVHLTTSCTDLLDIASAGLLLSDARGNLHLMASSSERTHYLEVLQLQRDEGPCLDCYRGRRPITVPDLNAEAERWPQFCEAAREAGLVSVHALPMRLKDNVLGTLGLFGDEVGELAHEDVVLAQALAHVATVAIINQRSAGDRAAIHSQLHHALTSRIVVEQAKGVVAYVGNIDIDLAFDALRHYAHARSLKLSDVAYDVVQHSLPAETIVQHLRSSS